MDKIKITILAACLGFLAGFISLTIWSSQPTYLYSFCKPGYSRLVRPPYSWSSSTKASMVFTNHSNLPVEAYELDHIIPIELGGDPLNPTNLQLQTWPDAKRKDLEENQLHWLVCHGDIPLNVAQLEMRNWK